MSRVIAIGTDLHQISRFPKILTRNGLDSFKTKRLSQRILHPVHELPRFNHFLNDKELGKCSELLANSWCVKEAIYKTLGSKDQKIFRMTDWFKVNDEDGRPVIGNEVYLNNNRKEQFLISLSHDGDYIMSTVLRQLKE